MRNKALIIALSVIVIFILSLIFSNVIKIVNINELNRNSNLDFDFGKVINEDSLGSFKEDSSGCFGCKVYVSSAYITSYTVSGYPDSMNSYKLTSFKTKDVVYQIYGINVGFDYNEAIKILKKQGYKQNQEIPNSYKRGNILIYLENNGNKIEEIRIRIQSSNVLGIIY